jgi:putative ABC transport system permease protein
MTAVAALILAALLQGTPRTIAVDERLAADAGLRVGDTVVLAAEAGMPGDTVRIGAILARRADPSEIARAEHRVLMHLDHLQRLGGYEDRVDRFAIQSAPHVDAGDVAALVNAQAFGFRAHRSADVAVETSETFRVISRFHRAIGFITILASAVFLLCILLLKVDERRRDVAALRLMGISRRSVTRSVVLEAALVAVAGSILGAGVGLVTSGIVNAYYGAVYRTPLRFALVTTDIVLLASLLSLVLGVLAGWLAARRLVARAPLDLLGR